MYSFPQFTRITLWGKFAWVGAIIFERNFMVRGQFSSEAIVRGAIIQWAIIWEAVFHGATSKLQEH